MTDPASLLAPNATPLQRAVERVMARRLERLTTEVDAVLDPDRCPAAFLPFLAWAVSVDVWRPTWPEARKRAVVKASLAVHRRKGTVAAVREALNALSARVELREWFTTGGAPFTATARVYASGRNGQDQLSPALLADLRAALASSGRATGHLAFEFGIDMPTPLTPGAAMVGAVEHAELAGTARREPRPFASPTPGAALTRPLERARLTGAARREGRPVARPAALACALTRPVVLARVGQLREAA